MSTNSTVSNAQHLANVANAMLSTGPRTEEGKAKARYNARRHGLTGQFYVMDEADRLAYLDFENGLFEDLAPATNYERQLAISIAQDHWRMNRVKGIEHNTLGLGHEEHIDDEDIEAASPAAGTAVTNARTWRSDNKGFANMALYESRLHRIITKNKKDLDELQTKRQAAESAAREEAELLLEEKLAEQDPIDQAQPIQINGFVFSSRTLLAEMAHKQAVAAARWYKSRHWDRTNPPPFALLTFPDAA